MPFKSAKQRKKVMMMLSKGAKVNIISGGFAGAQGVVIGEGVKGFALDQKRGRKETFFPIKIIGATKIDRAFGQNKFWHGRREIKIIKPKPFSTKEPFESLTIQGQKEIKARRR